MPVRPNSRLGRLEGFQEDRIYDNEFDAREYAKEAAGASFADYEEDFEKGIRDLRGQQVSMGRLRTGFATEDEDELVQDLNRRTARELARGAFTAAGLDLENQNLIDERAAGLHDVLQARRNQNQKKRRGLLGFLGGAVGGVGGFLLGGPQGAVAGARAGSTLGQSI